jgi:3-hydroxy-9,10-secoandrosta-1,3,5(10)-triene-9,17-dione monooxygenase
MALWDASTRTLSAPQIEMLKATEALVPALRERRAETNELRRLPDSTLAELTEIGVLGSLVPTSLGGPGYDLDFVLEVVMTLGRGCGPTAWCAGNWAVHNFYVAMFPEESRNAVFGGSKNPIVSTGFSPLRASAQRTDGGVILNGQWDFASGIRHASWVVLMAILDDGANAMLVPTSEVEIIDTWHTTGLRGTGSCDVAVKDLFVPEGRMQNMTPIVEGSTGVTTMPLPAFFGLGVVGSILGMGLGALEVFTERTAENIGGLSGVKAGTRPEIHAVLGESAAEIESAITLVRSMFAEACAVGQRRQPAPQDQRLRWRLNHAYATKLAVQATQRLFQVGGAHVLWSDDLLNQFHNDIVAASHHYGMAWHSLFSGYGRFKLGLDSGIMWA